MLFKESIISFLEIYSVYSQSYWFKFQSQWHCGSFWAFVATAASLILIEELLFKYIYFILNKSSIRGKSNKTTLWS